MFSCITCSNGFLWFCNVPHLHNGQKDISHQHTCSAVRGQPVHESPMENVCVTVTQMSHICHHNVTQNVGLNWCSQKKIGNCNRNRRIQSHIDPEHPKITKETNLAQNGNKRVSQVHCLKLTRYKIAPMGSHARPTRKFHETVQTFQRSHRPSGQMAQTGECPLLAETPNAEHGPYRHQQRLTGISDNISNPNALQTILTNRGMSKH